MNEELVSLTRDERICLWVYKNRGVCAGIARKHGVGRTYVREILYGGKGFKSKDLRIEKSLAEAGAPFMKERIGDAA